MSEQYADPQILHTIRSLIPPKVLHAGSDELLVSLLKWFKEDFMQWMPTKITCPKCISATMQTVVESGASWRIRKTEVHTCPKCSHVIVFPRHGEILKIAEARIGRCSEWSMLFGAVMNSLTMPARIVQDYLDHCWNETTTAGGSWVHIDSTLSFPISLDHPHYYEQNWGKKYLHVLAFDPTNVEDVTQRYTEQWDIVLQRRKESNDLGFDEKVFLPEYLQKIYEAI